MQLAGVQRVEIVQPCASELPHLFSTACGLAELRSKPLSNEMNGFASLGLGLRELAKPQSIEYAFERCRP